MENPGSRGDNWVITAPPFRKLFNSRCPADSQDHPLSVLRRGNAFLDAGKNGLVRDTKRDATAGEVHQLKMEAEIPSSGVGRAQGPGDPAAPSFLRMR